MKKIILNLSLLLLSLNVCAVDLKIDDPAPRFKVNTHEGKIFELEARKGKWTVLYFYPKAETPGCTKQACSFRDNIKKIRDLNADVFGISTNDVKEQADFYKNHNLNFILLADPKAEVTNLYGSKMAIINMSKRWTFVIDPNLIIKNISRDVDPVLDAERVAKIISDLQKK